jgi:hypothetical protein
MKRLATFDVLGTAQAPNHTSALGAGRRTMLWRTVDGIATDAAAHYGQAEVGGLAG